MSSVIRQLKNWFTKQNIYPQTVEQAIYDSEGRRLDNKIANGLSNPNLLINADFRNPVNQRGSSTPTLNNYWIDRWLVQNGGEEFLSWELSKVSNGLHFKSDNTHRCWLTQPLEFPDTYKGRTFTISSKIDGVVYSKSFSIPSNADFNVYTVYGYSRIKPKETTDMGSLLVQSDGGGNLDFIILASNEADFTVEWAKLEEGEIATPFRPRLYAEELQLCKRYYQIIKPDGISYIGEGMRATDVTTYLMVKLEVEMRMTPKISVSLGTSPLIWCDGATYTVSGLNVDYVISRIILYMKATHTSCTKTANRQLSVGTGGYIAIDAEL